MRKLLKSILIIPCRNLSFRFLFLFIFFSHSGLLHSENISILYFNNNTGRPDLQWMSKGFTDMLIGDLSRIPDLSIVEREDLNKILKEQSLSQSGLTEGKGIEIGRLLSSNLLIMGSYTAGGETLRFDARISDTESGKILHSVKVEGSISKALDLEKNLAGQIIDKLGKKRPEGLENKDTDSLEAAVHYYQGLDLLDSGKADVALKKFKEASDSDPNYAKPVEGTEKSYLFLNDFRKQRQQREISNLYKMIQAYQKKLNTEPWINYPGWLMKNAGMKPEESKKFMDSPDGRALMNCDVPARCVWHLMMTRIEAGDKYEEYFNDTKKKESLYRENLKDAARAAKAFKGDPVLSEVLYMELFSLRILQEKKSLQAKAKDFMIAYPDYRLIEFVEDWYEASLQEESD